MPFTFRHQPLKTIYAVVGLFTVPLRLPLWTLRNLLPSWRPRPSWSLSRSLFVEVVNAVMAIMLETSIPTPEPLEKLALSSDKTGFVWVEATPDLIVGDIRHFAELNGVKPARIAGFWYGKKGTDNSFGQKASPREKVIYHLHGGGFVMGSAKPSSPASAQLFRGLFEHLPGVSRIFALEYRLASGPPFEIRNPFPAPLVDALAGYCYLVEQIGFEPKNIIIAGDSAGGMMAYQLTRYLATYKPSGLLRAGALLLLSPSCNLAMRSMPGSMCTNRRSDIVRTWFDGGYGARSLLGSLPGEIDNTWLSPGSPITQTDDFRAIFKSFPPTFILAGEAEMGRDAMRILNDRMKTIMGEDRVTYVEVTDAPHDFLCMAMMEPERTVGLKEIGRWADTL